MWLLFIQLVCILRWSEQDLQRLGYAITVQINAGFSVPKEAAFAVGETIAQKQCTLSKDALTYKRIILKKITLFLQDFWYFMQAAI